MLNGHVIRPCSVRRLPVPDGVDVAGSEFQPLVPGCQGIEIIVCRERHETADPGQIEMVFGVYRHHVAPLSPQPLHIRCLDVFPGLVRDDGSDSVFYRVSAMVRAKSSAPTMRKPWGSGSATWSQIKYLVDMHIFHVAQQGPPQSHRE